MSDEQRIIGRARVTLIANGHTHISEEVILAERCELCGEFRHLRPFGPNGERICLRCGIKDPGTIQRMWASMGQAITPAEAENILARLRQFIGRKP